jgi:hypothetical protein
MRSMSLLLILAILSKFFLVGPSDVQAADVLLSLLHSFKQTKAMSALLFERSKRQKNSVGRDREDVVGTENRAEGREGSDIKKLVESVKRKSSSALGDNGGVGKRRKF